MEKKRFEEESGLILRDMFVLRPQWGVVLFPCRAPSVSLAVARQRALTTLLNVIYFVILLFSVYPSLIYMTIGSCAHRRE
jgi:hypothetical protein